MCAKSTRPKQALLRRPKEGAILPTRTRLNSRPETPQKALSKRPVDNVTDGSCLPLGLPVSVIVGLLRQVYVRRLRMDGSFNE